MFTLYMNLCVVSIGSSLVCIYLFLAALPVQYEGSPEPISRSIFNAVKVRVTIARTGATCRSSTDRGVKSRTSVPKHYSILHANREHTPSIA